MSLGTQSQGNSQAYSETGQRDNGSVSHAQDRQIRLTEIQRSVEGATFPADKKALADYARQQDAPLYVVDLLEQLPTPQFGSGNDEKLTQYADIHELMGEIEKIE